MYYPGGDLIQGHPGLFPGLGINPAIKKITFFAASLNELKKCGFLYRGANTGAPLPLSRVGLNAGARKYLFLGTFFSYYISIICFEYSFITLNVLAGLWPQWPSYLEIFFLQIP